MDFDLSQREIELIISALRVNEKHNKVGFSKWIANNLGFVDKQILDERINRDLIAYKELIDLRSKFGDTKAVKLD